MRLRLILSASLTASAVAASVPSAVDAQSSVYTSTAPKACRVLSQGGAEEDGGSRLCPGHGGLSVLIAEGDLRETVSVGRTAKDAAEQPAARAWFGPFSSTTETIEWRLDAAAKPYATIQRWHLADNDDLEPNGNPRTKALLAVTRMPPGPVCHVAYVDAAANPNANVLARQAADQIARDFRCGTDRLKVIGAKGRATELSGAR
jgi:hypothetical protein